MDQWTVRDQLCLASCVMRLGEDNWANVSKHLRMLVEHTRSSSEMFSLKNCASEYSRLIESISAPKRRRVDGGGAQPPAAQLVSKLTLIRIEELKKTCQLQQLEYHKLQREIQEIEERQASRLKPGNETPSAATKSPPPTKSFPISPPPIRSPPAKAARNLSPQSKKPTTIIKSPPISSPSGKSSVVEPLPPASPSSKEESSPASEEDPELIGGRTTGRAPEEIQEEESGEEEEDHSSSTEELPPPFEIEQEAKEEQEDNDESSEEDQEENDDLEEEEEDEEEEYLDEENDSDYEANGEGAKSSTTATVPGKQRRLLAAKAEKPTTESSAASRSGRAGGMRTRRTRGQTTGDHSTSGKQSSDSVGTPASDDRKRKRDDTPPPASSSPPVSSSEQTLLLLPEEVSPYGDDTSTSSTPAVGTPDEDDVTTTPGGVPTPTTPGVPTPNTSGVPTPTTASPGGVVTFGLAGVDDEGSNDVFEETETKSASFGSPSRSPPSVGEMAKLAVSRPTVEVDGDKPAELSMSAGGSMTPKVDQSPMDEVKAAVLVEAGNSENKEDAPSDKPSAMEQSPTTPDQEYREPIILKIKKPQPKTPPKSRRSGSSKDGSPSSRRSTTPRSPRLRTAELLARRRSPSPEDEIEIGPPGSTPMTTELLKPSGSEVQELASLHSPLQSQVSNKQTIQVRIPPQGSVVFSDDLESKTSLAPAVPDESKTLVDEDRKIVSNLPILLDQPCTSTTSFGNNSEPATDSLPVASQASEIVSAESANIPESDSIDGKPAANQLSVPILTVSSDEPEPPHDSKPDVSSLIPIPNDLNPSGAGSVKTEEGKMEEGKTEECKMEVCKMEEGKMEDGKTEECKMEEGKTEEVAAAAPTSDVADSPMPESSIKLEKETEVVTTSTRSGLKTRRSAVQEKLENARTKLGTPVASRRGRAKAENKSSDALASPVSCPANFTTLEEYKLWKKTMMLIWKAAAGHRHANVFLHPVTDEIAPDYNKIVFSPMDLSTIKKNVESAVIVTTEEFQKAILLMFANAVMYNNSDHEVHQMATEMFADVVRHMKEILPTADHAFSLAADSVLNSPALEASAARSGKSLRSRAAGRASTGTPSLLLASSSPLPPKVGIASTAASISGSAGDLTSSDLDVSCNRSLCGSDIEEPPLTRRLRHT